MYQTSSLGQHVAAFPCSVLCITYSIATSEVHLPALHVGCVPVACQDGPSHDADNLRPMTAGWVREMYAWDIGVAANKLNIQNQGPPHTPLISQPPHDHRAHNASMYHYTW